MRENKNSRQNKVASEIKRILSEYFLRNAIVDFDGIKMSLISITDVVISSCLQHVKVYIVSLSNDVSLEECLAFLQRHVSQVRRHLANNIRLKFVPEIQFFIDNTQEHANRIESLLQQVLPTES